MNGVISGNGVPTAGDFPATSAGTPIYINLATGTSYYLDAANAVQPIGGGSGGGDMLKSENLSGLANYTTARSNMGLGSAATTASTAYATAAQGTTADSALQPSGNGSSLTGLTKTQVGLANADNTSDASKPVSSATQTALNLKANIASPTFTGTVGGVTASMVGLGNVDNTTDAGKPVSTAQQTALNLKANLASPTFTGTVGGITAAMVGAPSGSGTSSGTNTGDNATNTQYSGIATSKQDALVSGTNIKTINGATVLGSGDLVVSGAQPDIPQVRIAPTSSQTIAAGYSAYVCGPYEIVTATSLEIGVGACLEIG